MTTDLDDAAVVAPALGLVDPGARIAVLAPWHIPFSGLHALAGKQRLERAVEQATRERLDAFARSSGIPGKLEKIVRPGAVYECTMDELDARAYELFVLAIKPEGSARPIHRVIQQLFDASSCDLFIARENDTRSGGAELWPAVP